MEETRRVGIVGRWLAHWSFWPTYAAGIVTLLLVTRPWHYWFRITPEATTTSTDTTSTKHFSFHFIRLHEEQNPPRPDASLSQVGMMAVTAGETQPDTEWIECDGRAVSPADYPELAAVIGNRFGSDEETVLLPDFSDLYFAGRMELGISDWLWLGRETDATSAQDTTTRLRFWIKAR